MFFSLLVALIAVGIPFLEPLVIRDKSLTRSTALVVLVHQMVSILQVVLDGIPTMRMDPLNFNRFAMTGSGSLNDEAYAQFLHFVYSLFGPSHLLGCQVSNIFFSLALVVEIRILSSLGYQRTLPRLILLFGLLPSCIVNTAVTLREAAQMFCYLAISLTLLHLSRQGPNAKIFILLPLSVGLINLHQGMAALVIACLPIALALALRARPMVLISLCVVATSGGVLVKDRVLSALTERSAVLHHISEGNISYLENYAQNVEKSRTSFNISLDLSSPGGILKTVPLQLTYYLFSPLPWQVRSTLDILGSVESFVRILLVICSVRALYRSRGPARRDRILLAFLLIVIECGWALGTANWGTAFRHRLVGWGLLVALGGSLFGEDPSCDDSSDRYPQPQSSLRSRRRALMKRAKRESQA